MGCAAVKGAPNQSATLEETVSDPPAAKAPQITIFPADSTDAPASASTSPSGAPSSPQKSDKNMLSDADDDDPEVIVETAPKQIRKEEPPQIAAANAQEAPDAKAIEDASRKKEQDEEEARQKKEEEELRRKEKAILSKQQQEEASKNAERRKAFEEKQKKQAQRNQVPITTVDNAALPSTDMVMGLNQGAAPAFMSPDDPFLDLPGGILDDLQTFPAPAQCIPSNKKKHTHDDVESTGFDDDDERLMQEILDLEV